MSTEALIFVLYGAGALATGVIVGSVVAGDEEDAMLIGLPALFAALFWPVIAAGFFLGVVAKAVRG